MATVPTSTTGSIEVRCPAVNLSGHVRGSMWSSPGHSANLFRKRALGEELTSVASLKGIAAVVRVRDLGNGGYAGLARCRRRGAVHGVH